MNNKNLTIRFLYYLSVVVLFVLYLFPGSIIGYLLYDDLSKQPNLISNPAGTSINHFIYFLFLSIVGLFGYLKDDSFKKVLIFLLFSSIILEVLHLIIPNRSFQYLDLISNFTGVLLGYCMVIIYKKWKNNE
jgi:VanZ family protein